MASLAPVADPIFFYFEQKYVDLTDPEARAALMRRVGPVYLPPFDGVLHEDGVTRSSLDGGHGSAFRPLSPTDSKKPPPASR